MQIIAIRHFMTAWNEKALLQGRSDQDILPPSDQDAILISENKKKIKDLDVFDHVLVSTLKRTTQTARVYGVNKQFIQKETLLDELDFGRDFEGKKRAGMMEIWEQCLKVPQKRIFGESLLEFASRIYAFISKYQNSQHLLIFGHGLWLRALWSLNQCSSLDAFGEFNLANNELVKINVNLETFIGREPAL